MGGGGLGACARGATARSRGSVMAAGTLLGKPAGRAVFRGDLVLRIELRGGEGRRPESAAILPTAQRFLFSLCDSYFGPAILILAQRFLFSRCYSYFGSAILAASQRSLFWPSYSYFVSAILILGQRFFQRASDPYLEPAILIFPLRF